MSDAKKSNPLTVKGILALIGAGLLALVAQLTGLGGLGSDKEASDTGGSTDAPVVGGGSSKEVATGAPSKNPPRPKPKSDAPKPNAPKKETSKPATPKAEDAAPKRDDTHLIKTLFNAQRSDTQVEFEGEVVHLLPDDNHGSRHQLFLCELTNGITLKISHNIDLAPYIDTLRKGDTVRIHGEYEWNDKGGVVHWTHRNTRGGSHPGGWIKHKGKTYQ